MPSLAEIVKKAEDLIQSAEQGGKCLAEAKAAQGALDNLREKAVVTFQDKLEGVIAIGAGVLVAGKWMVILGIGVVGLSLMLLLLKYYARVLKAKRKLERAIKALEDCLNR